MVLTIGDDTLAVASLTSKETLKVYSLHTRKSRADSEIQNNPSLDSICLSLIQIYRILGGVMDLSERNVMHVKRGNNKRANCAMIALNRARLTRRLGFTLRQTRTISDPICSPSLSQSVQIINVFARLASLSRFFSMFLASSDTWVSTGASNSSKGSHDPHFLCVRVKSWVVRWPETDVTTNCAFVCG